jgi:hypothetical protein
MPATFPIAKQILSIRYADSAQCFFRLPWYESFDKKFFNVHLQQKQIGGISAELCIRTGFVLFNPGHRELSSGSKRTIFRNSLINKDYVSAGGCEKRLFNLRNCDSAIEQSN